MKQIVFGLLTMVLWVILSICGMSVYVWTILIAFGEKGLVWAIVCACLPGISQLIYAGVFTYTLGIINTYNLALLGLMLLYGLVMLTGYIAGASKAQNES